MKAMHALIIINLFLGMTSSYAMEKEQQSAPDNDALALVTPQGDATAATRLAHIQRMVALENKIKLQKEAKQKRAALKGEVPTEAFLVARIYSAPEADKAAMQASCIKWLQYRQMINNMRETGLP